ncbi:MAG: hypothetical protein ACI9LM_003042 [Alteromonadaceae bacterium]|jgi:hypothetical protein
MLLKLNNKAKRYNTIFFIILSLLLNRSAVADETFDNAWRVHGFVAQGMINVNGSDFVNDDQDLSFKLTEVGVNSSYQYSTNLRFTAQAVYLEGGNRYSKGARIDYALIDWTAYNDVNWLVKIYLGRYKNNHWLYSSTRDVPHTRPSIILPQALYFDGFRDIAMGSDGAAIKINYSTDDAGYFDFNFSYGSSILSSKEAKVLLGESALGTGKQKFDAQASLYWQPNYSPWRFGLSLLDSDFNYRRDQQDFFADATFSFQQYSFSAIYEGEYWQFSSEIFQQKFSQYGFFYPRFHQSKIGQGAYAQFQYKYNDQLKFLSRVERFYADKNDRNGKKLEENTQGVIPRYFGYQHDITLGASFDFTEKIRLQIEYHRVKGTSRLTPIMQPNKLINNAEKWSLWALQLMYWF